MMAENQLTLHINPELSDLIERVRTLKTVVIKIENKAKSDSKQIDYSNFPQYTELHNLYSKMRYQLAESACFALNLRTIS